MSDSIRIHPHDNVAVALRPVKAGERLCPAVGVQVTAAEDIPQGHKLALAPIAAGENAIKYGYPIGHATADIPAGGWVHTHNLKTNLRDGGEFTYRPDFAPLPEQQPGTFRGFLRPDGRAAIRNELWILPAVGCVNCVAEKLVRDNQHLVGGSIDGLYTFPHPFGCSQTGGDHAQTRKLLAALANHPNAGGVLVLGLGCENLTMEQFRAELGEYEESRIRFLVCQEVEDEYAEAARLLAQLADYAKAFTRRPLPAAKLVVGLKCGGSDGLSGITANPVVGAFSDMLVAQGGSTILTEVPEMFGAEDVLLKRCITPAVFQRAADMMQGFKQYFTAHGQPVYENPSPGNKQGGITTLEDKSLGCVQKGGSAPVVDVIGYGGQVQAPGLNLLCGPGNDLVSATAMTAAGAHMVLFTTGRGTPFGAPAPTLKISTNSALYSKKPGWLDFNAGTAAEGEPIATVAAGLMQKVLRVASGEKTKTEQQGFREISIFKDGVVL